MKDDNKTILEEHLKVLQNAAKKECSGEDLKAITEAMIMVVGLISKNENAEIEMEDVVAVVHADKSITLEPVKKDSEGARLTKDERKSIICHYLLDDDFDVPDELIDLITSYAKIRAYQERKKQSQKQTIENAFKEAQANQTVNIQFTGSLAQLAQILKPEIRKEDT